MAWDADPLSAAFAQLEEAEKAMDPRTSELVTYHALIRQLMIDAVSSRFRASRHIEQLPYSHLVSVLAAFIPPDNKPFTSIVSVLRAFDRLRNAASHRKRDHSLEIDRCYEIVRKLLYEDDMPPDQGVKGVVATIAFVLAGLKFNIGSDAWFAPPEID